MKKIYTAKATSIGGRKGHVETDDKRLSFDLTQSNSNTGTNPEQLFACGYCACFGSALEATAKKLNVDIIDAQVSIEVSLNQDDKSEFFLSVAIHVTLPSLDKTKAEKLVNDAHQICPYSKATRGNIDVTLKVNNQELSQAA